MYVYLIEQGGTPFFKIGVSNDPQSRLAQLQTASPHKLSIRYVIACVDETASRHIEATLHDMYKSMRRAGEWFEGDLNQVIALLEFSFDLSRHCIGGFVPNTVIEQTPIVLRRHRNTSQPKRAILDQKINARSRVIQFLNNHPEATAWSVRALANASGVGKTVAAEVLNEWKLEHQEVTP